MQVSVVDPRVPDHTLQRIGEVERVADVGDVGTIWADVHKPWLGALSASLAVTITEQAGHPESRNRGRKGRLGNIRQKNGDQKFQIIEGN